MNRIIVLSLSCRDIRVSHYSVLVGHKKYSRYPIPIINHQSKLFLILSIKQTHHKIENQEKVSEPDPLSHNYINYSDIKIRYTFFCKSGFFYFLEPRKNLLIFPILSS